MNFMPHGYCMRWEPGLLSLHVFADALIALSYFSIPFALLYFINRRSDIQFRGIFVLFAAFILSCGITHVISISSMWHPHYWLEGWVKLVTGLVSAYTAYRLWPAIPQALRIPSPSQLEVANRKLESEIEDNRKTHQALEKLNRELEERVQKRTEELEKTLTEVKRLQSTVTTICAWTKRVKDQGEWVSFEEFLNKHLGLQFTHGISEEGLKALKEDFPTIAQDMRKVTGLIPKPQAPSPDSGA